MKYKRWCVKMVFLIKCGKKNHWRYVVNECNSFLSTSVNLKMNILAIYFKKVLNIVSMCQYNLYCQLIFYMLISVEVSRDYLKFVDF